MTCRPLGIARTGLDLRFKAVADNEWIRVPRVCIRSEAPGHINLANIPPAMARLNRFHEQPHAHHGLIGDRPMPHVPIPWLDQRRRR